MKKVTQKYLSGSLILKETETQGALILGDCNSAIDKLIIKPNNVKTLISIGEEALPDKNKIEKGITHKFYDLHDNKQQKVPTELFDEIVDLIEEGRSKGGVLIHCFAGVSRSATFVIAYIMKSFYINYDEAKEKVKKKRSCICPGDGFVRQLQAYWKVLVKREEERLAKLKQKEIVPIEPQPKEQKIEPKEKTGVKGAVKSASGISPEKSKILKAEKKSQKIEEQDQKMKIGHEEINSKSIIMNQKQGDKSNVKNNVKLSPQNQKTDKNQFMTHKELRKSIEKIQATSVSNVAGDVGNDVIKQKSTKKEKEKAIKNVYAAKTKII